MLHRKWRCIVIFLCFSILEEGIHGQNIIGTTCTVESSGSSGTCRLITTCQKIRDELVQFNRLPQTCGFQGTQAIVCCPKEVKKPGDISRQKCREYSALTNRCSHRIVKRVIYGETSLRAEFPHMALLGYERKFGEKVEIKWSCAGTIISEEYILTGALCIVFGGPKSVRIGFTNIHDQEHRQEIKVSKIISHPNHENWTVYNDLALLKLEKSIQFNSRARPACLFTNSQIPAEKAIATGWGATQYGPYSKDLLKVTLELIDYELCSREYRSNKTRELALDRGVIDEQQICTREDADRLPKHECLGDLGGPLQIYNSDLCMYDVIGVTSIGTWECTPGIPSLYTRVSHYVKWIEDIVWPQSPAS